LGTIVLFKDISFTPTAKLTPTDVKITVGVAEAFCVKFCEILLETAEFSIVMIFNRFYEPFPMLITSSVAEVETTVKEIGIVPHKTLIKKLLLGHF
jgi:hypothetical protein